MTTQISAVKDFIHISNTFAFHTLSPLPSVKGEVNQKLRQRLFITGWGHKMIKLHFNSCLSFFPWDNSWIETILFFYIKVCLQVLGGGTVWHMKKLFSGYRIGCMNLLDWLPLPCQWCLFGEGGLHCGWYRQQVFTIKSIWNKKKRKMYIKVCRRTERKFL